MVQCWGLGKNLDSPIFPLFSSVQLLSHVRLFAIPWTTAHEASPSITNSQGLPKLMSTELVMSSPSPPALNLSQHQGLFQ